MNWLSAAVGLPLPVGGLIGLRFRHPLGEDVNVQVAAGLSILGPNFAVTGVVEYPSGFLWGVGADATMYVPIFGGKIAPLPGVHGQFGHAWYLADEWLRVALVLSVGLPQLVGLALEVGL